MGALILPWEQRRERFRGAVVLAIVFLVVGFCLGTLASGVREAQAADDPGPAIRAERSLRAQEAQARALEQLVVEAKRCMR